MTLIVFVLVSGSASAALFSQCPPVQQSPGCAVLITINKNGAVTVATDPSIGPYDGSEDTLVGVVNKSGATVFGMFLQGANIFGFDGDGANGGDYAGPGISFSLADANSGTVNFINGLDDGKSLWFSLEGPPSSIKLSRTITVDPGHGGTMCAAYETAVGGDTGTFGPTYKDTEDALALSIGLKLQAKFAAHQDKAVMTRTTAICPSLKARAELANEANTNVFVSIHFNGNDNPNVNGTEVWYFPPKLSSSQLATFNENSIVATLGTANRGIKRAGTDGKGLYVLSHTRLTAVLIEVAFLKNVRGDEDIMHRPAATDDTAAAIYNAVQNFLNQ